MAGVVNSKRISNRDKDKPRLLYSIAGNLSYVIATSDNFVDKKLVSLSAHNKVILKIWFLDDPEVRYALEKVFWQIEPHFASLNKLCFAGLENGVPILEYSGKDKLPTSIACQGRYSQVKLRLTKVPAGQVLFERTL